MMRAGLAGRTKRPSGPTAEAPSCVFQKTSVSRNPGKLEKTRVSRQPGKTTYYYAA